jgi:hypothetical protein
MLFWALASRILPNSVFGLPPTIPVVVYIHAPTILRNSYPYILRIYKRNNPPASPAKSNLTLHPHHSHQVYANHSILRIALQLLEFFKQYVLPRSKIRPGMAGRPQ